MNSRPKVSVVMPAYNSEPFISRSVESVLRQTLEDLELVVVDDGSKDGTAALVEGFRDPRVRLVRNEQNRGIAFSRNRGIEASRGEYVAMLDSDDIALPERLAEQAAFLDRHPDYGLLGGWFATIDKAGEATGEVVKYLTPADEIPALLLFNNCFAQSTVMLRKSMLPEGPYRELAPAEDYDLWIRMARRAKVGTLQKVLAYYRVHGGNVSVSQMAKQESCTRRVLAAYLTDFGVEPSDAELELHRSIATLKFEPSPAFLERCEAWLGKLLQANRSGGFFDAALFERMVSARWYACCRMSCALGRGAWNSYWRSPLAALRRLRITQKVRFFVLTTTKGWRRGTSLPLRRR